MSIAVVTMPCDYVAYGPFPNLQVGSLFERELVNVHNLFHVEIYIYMYRL